MAVLFVCTANIARSPYAERRATHLLAGAGSEGAVFASAGIPDVSARLMDREMTAQLSARGGTPTATSAARSRAKSSSRVTW
jgi:protein-tyrosine-phosphatase